MALSPEERACYEWQIWVPGFGEAGQEKLKEATVMVSRCGGLGGEPGGGCRLTGGGPGLCPVAAPAATAAGPP